MNRYVSIIALLLLTMVIFNACTQNAPVTDQSSIKVTEQMTDLESQTEEISLPPDLKTALRIVSGTGEVYPYSDQIKEFLLSAPGSNVADYLYQTENQAKAITVSWELLSENITAIELVYGPVNSDPSERVTVMLEADATSYDLYNLYKSTDYEWSVTAIFENGERSASESAIFRTTDLGPRTLQITGVYNTRDIGGYLTEDGKVTKQGMIIRGGELPKTLKKDAKEIMTKTLGIKCEIDLRGYGKESGFRKKSPISDAKLEYVTTDAYTGAFKLADSFRKVFSLMSNKDNYPIYVHCTGGADRTGTVIYLLNALLGVPEDLLIKDYEFTSFSYYGERNTAPDTLYGSLFMGFRAMLEEMPGDTLSQKTAAYMLSIGVTEQEIANIRAIMTDEPTELTATTTDLYTTNVDADLNIYVANIGAAKLTGITLNQSVISDYDCHGSVVAIPEQIMSALPNGDVTVTLHYDDGRQATCSLVKNQAVVKGVSEYLPLSDGKLKLNENQTSVLGTKAVGYGEFVKLDIKTEVIGENSGWWIAIGSYAFHIRALSIRVWVTTDGMNYTECQPRVEIGMERKAFNNGAAVYYCVEEIDEKTVRATMIIFDDLGEKQTVTYDFSRITGEISSENAALSIAIRTDEVKELTITE